MSAFSISGNEINAAFAAAGGALLAVYDLNGNALWTAGPFQSSFSGAWVPFAGWKFHLVSPTADTSYSSEAEAATNFDDSTWESVTIPHDWSIYRDFNADSASTYEGGFLDGGDAWYRCKIHATTEMLTSKTLLYFEAVYMECTVYLNGQQVGTHHYGYAPFALDVSDTLKEGENTLAIFVRNRQPGCRWYSGSGIFRPCYLLAIEKDGISVTDIYVTSPELETEHDGTVNTKVSCAVTGTAGTTVTVTAEIGYQGSRVSIGAAEAKLAEGKNTVTVMLPVAKPHLWDVGNGQLYQAVVHVTAGEKTVDSYTVAFGYRWTKWDVDTGFWLNGRNLKLNGVYMHQDLGCLGSEANRSAMARQIDSMMQMGCNMIRIAHCPSSTDYLNLCAEKGIMCVEDFFDCWSSPKKPYDFGNYFLAEYDSVIDTVVKRDRNNPAIILWSIGDEVSTNLSGGDYSISSVTELGQKVVASVKARDTTRPVTMGENRPNTDLGRARMALMDVVGINYNEQDLSYPHSIGKPVYSSGTSTATSSRGIYAHDYWGLQCSSMDDDTPVWGGYAGSDLRKNLENPYSGGVCVWTGWDYIGEPTPFNKYPAKSSYFGICDLAGFPKDIYYMYQSRWTTDPMIHILPMDWDSWTVGNAVPVWLYSNCPSMELFQDGVSLGKKTQADAGEKYQFAYSVTFAKGTLTAKGYDANGAVVATDEVRSSTGTPAKLQLTSYRPTVDIGTDDLVFVTCDVLDKNGVFVPKADTKITFACEGGTVLGTDNGNAACVENMRSNVRSAFNGKALCVCRHDGQTGAMTITAIADGVESGSVTVTKERT